MRLTLSAYVTVEREEGRSVYVCQPLRGPQFTTRDPLLSTSLSKLGDKFRRSINGWIQGGQVHRISPWLYDIDTQSKIAKLTLTLRDRTLRWKLLLVTLPEFGRYLAFSPSVPGVVFEVASIQELEHRATEVYTTWAQATIAAGEPMPTALSDMSDMWVEPLELDVETTVSTKKKPKNIFAALFGGEKMRGSDELHKVGQCLDAVSDDFEPALGRSELVDEVYRMLCRDDRQNVLVVGPPAVGKSAIIHECVRRRAEHFRGRRDHKPRVWWLSPQRLISGMSYLGQWEQRWLAILREATKRDHILYFDDLVGLFTAGRTRDSNLSAADVLRSYLAEHRVRILAESTAEQLALLRRRDRSLADQFHLVHVPSLSSNDALPIVLESAHHVESQMLRYFHPEVIPLVMRHQEIYSPDRAFPGKAIEMTKTLAKHASEVVDRGTFYRLAGTQVGANLMLLLGRLGDQQSIRGALENQLIGQPDAVDALSEVVVRFSQHLQPPDRPLGVLLFLGPTGVGKTESAKALTRLLYNDDSHLVRLDMNELTTPIAAEQLVGTFDQPEGRLTPAVRRKPNCVILLDEIEKAHPDVFDYLLQVIGEGRLTDARGRIADFRSAIIIMTSNLGAAEQNSSLGFDITTERRTQIYQRAAQSFFRPEFFNRIDKVVAFRRLEASDMEKIVRVQMDEVLSRDGLQRRDIFVRVTESAIRRVIQTGFDSQLGARAVRRMLEQQIIGPLGDCLSNLPMQNPALVHIADSAAASQLACQVTRLGVVPRVQQRRISNLERLIELGDALHARLDDQLNGLADELKRVDADYADQSHNFSYYAIREQVYRCAELLKAAKFTLSRKGEPKLDLTAPLSSKPKRDTDGAGAKRMMRDWLAHEDLRSAIKEPDLLDSVGDFSTEKLAHQIVDNFTITSIMIQYSLAPRDWLIGFHDVTNGSSTEPLNNAMKRRIGSDYEIFTNLGGTPDFLTRIISCLKHKWHYEVKTCDISSCFYHVAGVSILGILKPLLGTYQIEVPGKSSHLSVFRAIPIDHHSTDSAIEAAISADKIMADDGSLITPSEQDFPTDRIRGSIGEQIRDYASGASLDLSSDDWFQSEPVLTNLLNWWTQCLSIPEELMES